MCGICGIVRPESSSAPAITDALVERMRDTLVHRGPDGEGLFVAPGVGLGHRRLSIIDVAHGAQPMYSDDGRFVIVYNGEVFNHPALKDELERDGVVYQTRCDTETVLHLVERMGADAPTKLRGMFAIAVWDRRERTLLLARDRFGVKPLYYVHRPDGSLLFGSEIKAILASGEVAPALNLDALPDYLANYAPSGHETLFQDVRRLPPGHVLVWRDGRIELRRYWDLTYGETENGSDEQLVEAFRDRLTEAVRLRLMSDVPLGMFLSGGIDSAAITAITSKLVDGRLNTFSVAFAEREANEFAYARLVAQHCGTEHHEITVSQQDFFGSWPTLLWHEDEPLAHPSSIALHYVSKLASEKVKVVLTGEGSDETLAGYPWHRATVYNERFGRTWKAALPSPARASVRALVGALPDGNRTVQRLRRTFLYIEPDFDTLHFDNFAVFSRARQRGLLSREVAARVGGLDVYAAAHAALARTTARTTLGKLLYTDINTYLHELLMKQDQMSMAASIESRVPFLDHPLVEFTARLPDRMKLRGLTTKYVLREAIRRDLPPEILSRKKMGFPVPIGPWFRGAWRHLVDDLVLSERALGRGLFDAAYVREMTARHMSGTENHGQRLWSLANLELWHRTFIDGEPREAVTRAVLAGAA